MPRPSSAGASPPTSARRGACSRRKCFSYHTASPLYNQPTDATPVYGVALDRYSVAPMDGRGASEVGPLSTTDSMKVVFRPLSAADHEVVREMMFQALFVRAGDEPFLRSVLDEPAIRRYYAGFGEVGTDAGVAAVVGGEVVGACWFRLFAGDDRGYGWVADDVPELTIALAPGYRGQGFGTKLLHAVLAIAVEMGFGSISLSVDPDCPARRVYERAGFIHVGWDDTSMTMQRPVP